MRDFKFQTGEFYHIYNRGVEKRDIFGEEKDFLRFLTSMRELNNNLGDSQRDYIKRKLSEGLKPDVGYPTSGFGGLFNYEICVKNGIFIDKNDFLPLVEFINYNLIPNHFHFTLRQLLEGGITKFMKKLGISYAKYFNLKYGHSGYLFQGEFKANHIDSDSYLLWLSGYINGNIEIHKIASADKWKWSSCVDYLGLRNGTLCNKQIIVDMVGNNVAECRDLIKMIIKESSEKKEELKKLDLE